MTPEYVIDVLRAANPIPSDDAIPHADTALGLVRVLERNEEMLSEHQVELQPKPPRKRSNWVTAAIAFGAVLVIFGIVAIVNTNNSTDQAAPPADPDEPTVTTTNSGQALALTLAEESIALYNSGDAEAWLESLPQAPNEALISAYMAAGDRLVIDICRVGEEGSQIHNGVFFEGRIVECDTSHSNSYFSAASIEVGAVLCWGIAEGGVVSFQFDDEDEVSIAYNTGLIAALRTSDPAGAEALRWVSPYGSPLFPAPETLDEAVQAARSHTSGS